VRAMDAREGGTAMDARKCERALDALEGVR
jgi:hypothetical protein